MEIAGVLPDRTGHGPAGWDCAIVLPLGAGALAAGWAQGMVVAAALLVLLGMAHGRIVCHAASGWQYLFRFGVKMM